jgi:peptidyl-prolyl cis-trans isomerase SurA
MREMRKETIRGDRGQQIGRAFSPWSNPCACSLGLRPRLVWAAPLALAACGVRTGLACVLAIVMLCGVACVGQGTGNREQGSAEQGTGNTERGTGNTEQGTGNREQGTGNTTAGAASAVERVVLDRVVAVVNGDLILESELDEEARMAAFQPFADRTAVTREQLVERLIDRDLILQQIRLQPQAQIMDAQVDAELRVLRKNIPECAAYGCETDAGWGKFVAAQGFTAEELRERWRQRMEVLRFVEARFRMGIRISQTEMDAYYKGTLVPAYEKERVTPPAEAAIADRIQEILLQQQVDKLLDDWLTSLRAEGSVKIVKPGEDLP